MKYVLWGYRVKTIEAWGVYGDGRLWAVVPWSPVVQVFAPGVDAFDTEEEALAVITRDIDRQRVIFDTLAEETRARIRDLRYEREKERLEDGTP